ncbi:MAG: hypothetical protein AAGA55_08720, partial [Planctomycetota bacterium]
MSVTDTPATENQTGHIATDISALKRENDPHATRWGDFLKATIKFNGSDLIMKSGQKPKIRLRGTLKALDVEPVSSEEFFEITKSILT